MVADGGGGALWSPSPSHRLRAEHPYPWPSTRGVGGPAQGQRATHSARGPERLAERELVSLEGAAMTLALPCHRALVQYLPFLIFVATFLATVGLASFHPVTPTKAWVPRFLQ